MSEARMRQRLASADLSLGELLSGRYEFSIPAYQRDYTWSREEASQLVDDIAGELAEDDGPVATPYFIGTMLLVDAARAAPTEGGRLPRPVDVVDGQQRLITLTILFAVLRDLAADEPSEAAHAEALDTLLAAPGSVGAGSVVAGVANDGDGDGRAYQLHLRSADAGFFREAIQRRGATRRGQSAATIGPSRARAAIEDVRRALRRKLMTEYDAQARRAFTDYARSNVRVLVVSSDDFDYAYQIFLTINDRGKRLSVEDIFRGEILGPLDPEHRRRYEAVIDEIDKYMQDGEKLRSKGKTFFSHLAAISGWRNRGIIAGLKQAVQRQGGPRRFATDVFGPMAEAYLQVKGDAAARPVAPGIADRLTVLRWLERHGDDDWVALAMLGLVRLGDDVPALDAYLGGLDRFAHGLMLMGCGRDARRRHYTPILKQLGSGRAIPPAEQLFALPATDQEKILHNVATRLYRADSPAARLVLVRADQAYSQRPLDYYQALLSPDRPAPERFTVEHVCPKGEIATGDWLRLFPQKRRRRLVAECIGNLVLVTEAQNKRASQAEFAAKKSILFPADAPAPFALTELLRPVTRWDGAAIEARYRVVMTTVAALWALEGEIPPCPAAEL